MLLGGLSLALALAVTVPNAVAGPKWEFGDDGSMQMSFLGQIHASYTQDAADEEAIFLKRGRLILSGQIMDGVKVFVETDNKTQGTEATPQTFIQDAYVDVRLGESDHWVQVGLILLPFSFENRASAASLLGIDYNSSTIRIADALVWRNCGAELHGNVGTEFAYRVGLFDGYGSIDEASLRCVGHVAVNLLGDVETGWFFTQNRLAKSEYITVGAGVDVQGKSISETSTDPVTSNEVTTVSDALSWVIDVQAGVGVSEEVSVLVNGAYYDWDNAAFKGSTAFIEGGVMYQKCMVTLKGELVDADGDGSTTDYTLGLHYFMKDHNARAGIEYRTGDSPDMALFGVQFLL